MTGTGTAIRVRDATKARSTLFVFGRIRSGMELVGEISPTGHSRICQSCGGSLRAAPGHSLRYAGHRNVRETTNRWSVETDQVTGKRQILHHGRRMPLGREYAVIRRLDDFEGQVYHTGSGRMSRSISPVNVSLLLALVRPYSIHSHHRRAGGRSDRIPAHAELCGAGVEFEDGSEYERNVKATIRPCVKARAWPTGISFRSISHRP